MKRLLFNLKRMSLIIVLASVSFFIQGQDYHFKYGFISGLPVGWEGSSLSFSSNNPSNLDWEGHYGGSNPIRINTLGELTTPAYFAAGTLSFWLMAEAEGVTNDFVVEKGIVDELGEVSWSTIYEETDAGVFAYKQITLEVNAGESLVKFRFRESGNVRRLFVDDVALTITEGDESRAEIAMLSVNGGPIADFSSLKYQYDLALTYPSIDFTDLVIYNREAAVVIEKPVDYFGSEAERTASIQVTSPDGTNTLVYEFVVDVTGIHAFVDFEDGRPVTWSVAGWFNSRGNGYESEYGGRFTRVDGSMITEFYKGIGSVEFYSKHEPGDDVMEKLNVSKLVIQGLDTIETHLAEFLNGVHIFDTYSKLEVQVDDNSEHVALKWQVEYANSSTRIYVDQVTISGHEDYLATSVNTAVSAPNVEIYPNPAQDWVRVVLPGILESQISVYNMTGNLVKTIQVKGKSEVEINVSDLTTGVYILAIESGNKVHSSKLMIK